MYHTEMIRNLGYRHSFSASLFAAILFHLVVLLLVKKSPLQLSILTPELLRSTRPLKIERIKLIKPSEVEQLKQLRRVGIKNGAKTKYFEPDMIKIPRPSPARPQTLTLGNLAPDLSAQQMIKKSANGSKKSNSNEEPKAPDKKDMALTDANARPSESGADEKGHFYFNPKKEKKIAQSREQDNLKQEAYKNITTSSSNPVAQKLSNFEIRYERPEGVSEDELNSDERAYYSFFKRSYANYLSKLYATYDKVSVERPGLEKDFENKHLLIGKIDYDEKGNIITIKILKSSESDNVHYFFEETLKQLNLPNPPKSFVKNKKQFTTYYQIQIN
ncbi:MAG: hypothetical protein ACXVLQ_00660 [Bacteriovorax sp.]